MGRAFEFRKARKLKRWATMAKTFTRLSKDIAIAVKDGGPNIDSNFKLRSIIQNAKSANMPKDNIERAIKNASNKNFENYKEVVLEGYSVGGIAVILDCISDNNNRTVGNVRSYFNKTNGNLATNGSVDFIFNKVCFFKIKFDGNKNNSPTFGVCRYVPICNPMRSVTPSTNSMQPSTSLPLYGFDSSHLFSYFGILRYITELMLHAV